MATYTVKLVDHTDSSSLKLFKSGIPEVKPGVLRRRVGRYAGRRERVVGNRDPAG
jgi:hypothetical protein